MAAEKFAVYDVCDDDYWKNESYDVSSLRVSQGIRGIVKCTKQEKSRRTKTNKDKSLTSSSSSETKNKYAKVKRAVLDAVDDQDRNIIEKLMKNLECVAKELLIQNDMVADESTIESGTLSLLKIFASHTESLTEKHANRLIVNFGPFASSTAKRAHQLVEQIRNSLPVCEKTSYNNNNRKENQGDQRGLRGILKYVESAELDEDDDSDTTSTDGAECFGQNVKFSLPSSKDIFDYEPLTSYLSQCNDLDASKSNNNNFNLSMKLDDVLKNKLLEQNENFSAAAAEFSTAGLDEFDLSTLMSYVSEFSENVAEICQSLISLLDSGKSDDMLQNDLFDLLGFDNFDLIMNVLQNRTKLVAEYNNLTASSSDKAQLNKFAQVSRKQAPPKVGQMITIETDRERQLAKEMRKEDKRLRKLVDKNMPTASSSSDVVDVDVARQQELLREYEMARNMPLFFKRDLPDVCQYPYVFDSSLAARRSAGFLAGNKMILPENVKRNDNKMYEEITLEPSPPPPSDIGKNRIQIADLDDLGKLAFRSTKQLNQIQTVVFDKAYHTNQNLLICAPTGAGKTNIAMLCILKVIRDFTHAGVIKMNDFKIVYVAPMKALAGEMVRNFGERLRPLGVTVKELTGDMQLTKQEIMRTQMLVTTPEKWDVVTRKSTGDVSLTHLVKLLIIDEIHLLHDDRGPVIETLVARTLRQIEMQQTTIRIVGLSATLPNYVDVARFLRVNLMEGLFFFDGRFRPVPLGQSFIGVKAPDYMTQMEHMDNVCYEKALHFVRQGYQVMVFVHARNATGRIAAILKETANNKGHSQIFIPENSASYGNAQKSVSKSRNRQLQELFPSGFAIHHAGMLRPDRNLVEKLFADGHVKVLCCTATLAWGINLPAHAVIIRGTEIYDAKKSSFVDLGILDVQQIFGRAGRPQFDTHGYGIIITTHAKLPHYISILTRQMPIESHFIDNLIDNLNAEIVLNSISNVDDAVQWLTYTYLYVRLRLNPLAYGLTYKQSLDESSFEIHLRSLIEAAALKLDQFKMIRYNPRVGTLVATDLGRTASHFYIKYDTVEVFNEEMKEIMTDDAILATIAKSGEFNELKVRDDEQEELDKLHCQDCRLPVAGGSENVHGKVNILLQGYVARTQLNSFSLISDSAYIIQNASRIMRALFTMMLRKNNSFLASAVLKLCKSLERQLWHDMHPLFQMTSVLSYQIIDKVKKIPLDKIREMPADELTQISRSRGADIKSAAFKIPNINVESHVFPITRNVLRVYLDIRAEFNWDNNLHGAGLEVFHVWIENPDNNVIYHKDEFALSKKQVIKKETVQLKFTVPLTEPMPSQYLVRWISDRWLGSESVHTLLLSGLILPDRFPSHTELLDLQPLPISALGNSESERIFKFTHFNAVQTQLFFCLYHTDYNALVGAPTGSGKTVAAELAVLRLLRHSPGFKVVYIAPLKALVRERMKDWQSRFGQILGKKVVELTGDVTPDMQTLSTADIVVTTPEKWDGISRSWQNRSYVRNVGLIIIDEIHLLGEERGPVLEVVVSRTNFISATTNRKVRIVGLSTALANAQDIADWLNIRQIGLYNFKPSVRPVPLEVHISGFPEKHYCPRMASMNKPAFQAIRTHSPTKPVLIFVSSRRQTRLTALDLLAYLAGNSNEKIWLHMDEREMEYLVKEIKDPNLKLSLMFGIGLHHAGLQENDRRIVEELFVNQKIQILIATATLAWGVNLPAHLVVIKGTEFYDGKTRRYVDFPITDVLQMMGRAGRPQFDDQGVAVVFVHDMKKDFYKKFLYDPFPVESNLLAVLSDHLNAEIVAGTITTKQQAMDYLTWTYFFRRVLVNPSYYNLENVESDKVNAYLTEIIDRSLLDLQTSNCVQIGDDNRMLNAQNLGRIASFYYLSHKTMKQFSENLSENSGCADLLKLLTSVTEYNEIPVRHNEDVINSELAKNCPIEVDRTTFDDSHTKTHLLYQAHFSRLKLPSTDYETDLKSVLDQSIRILQAMLDVSAEQGWLATSIKITQLIQMVVQSRWITDSPLSILPHVEPELVKYFKVSMLPQLQSICRKQRVYLIDSLKGVLDPREIEDILKVLSQLPIMNIRLSVNGWWKGETQVKNVRINLTETNIRDAAYLPVHADQEYILSVDLERLNKKQDSRAYAPKFPKIKDEGWFLILGDIERRELLALKRLGGVRHRSSTNVAFRTPNQTGRCIYTLYLLSDSYLGLDNQYDVYLDVLPPSVECQVNSEVLLDDDES